jgi:hypothetical protein
MFTLIVLHSQREIQEMEKPGRHLDSFEFPSPKDNLYQVNTKFDWNWPVGSGEVSVLANHKGYGPLVRGFTSPKAH